MEMKKLARKELLEAKLKDYGCYASTYKRYKALMAHYFLIKIYNQEADREQKDYLIKDRLEQAKKNLKRLIILGDQASDDAVFKDDIVLGRYLLSKAYSLLGDKNKARTALNSAELHLHEWEEQISNEERKYDDERKSDILNPKREELKKIFRWHEKLERLEEDLQWI